MSTKHKIRNREKLHFISYVTVEGIMWEELDYLML
jgi:hypothetical protein